ncbi:hypothetical protein EVAR_13771_1 [Eumeta japonica]|uniref:PiggyBac transposable element-derived protein domain-containing protein n=1 Tax=Eumeta variegata TaxID=151549 RepID=A0A4C1U0Y3_EUMVA|nr:hypothetical protein EVAR_13771_1 [Eumeta japonica]
MAQKRPINEQEILRLIELDDLSECDSDEGGEFASHISTPSDSYLTLPDDVLVEKRLEEIFGIDNELHEDSPPDTGYDNEGSLYDDLQPIFSEIDQLDDQFPSSTPEQSTTPLQSSSTVQSSILASRPSTSHDIVFQRNARSTNNNAKPRSWKMLRKVPKIPNFDKKITSVTASPITAIKWLDTREVTVLTTAHQPRDTTFVKRTQKNGSRQEVLCPKAIADYTLSMGGVDRKARPTIFKNKKGGNFGVPDEIRLRNVGVHFPDQDTTYKRCRFCSTKNKEKRSNIKCSECGVTLCVKTCFKNFHAAEAQEN